MPVDEILAWHIYHIPDCQHAKPNPKDKFVIVVCINDDYCLGFFINTSINKFIQGNSHLLGCQTTILSDEHECLSYDSYIDTSTVLKLSHSELVDVKQEISDNAKKSLMQAVDYCIVIETRFKKQILKVGQQYLSSSDAEE